MKITLQRCVLAACLALCPIALFAQSSEQNLEACKAGREACDRSKLSGAELADLARVQHIANLSNCRNGFDPCDRSKLTPREATALAVADHQRDVSACTGGMGSCDTSKLTASEARDSSLAEHKRNLADCKDGIGNCDPSQLSPSEAGAVNTARHELNFSDCKNGAGLCDHLRQQPDGNQLPVCARIRGHGAGIHILFHRDVSGVAGSAQLARIEPSANGGVREEHCCAWNRRRDGG